MDAPSGRSGDGATGQEDGYGTQSGTGQGSSQAFQQGPEQQSQVAQPAGAESESIAGLESAAAIPASATGGGMDQPARGVGGQHISLVA
jgi:hypothetical protein